MRLRTVLRDVQEAPFAPKVIKAGAGSHNLSLVSREGGELPFEPQGGSDSDNGSNVMTEARSLTSTPSLTWFSAISLPCVPYPTLPLVP